MMSLQSRRELAASLRSRYQSECKSGKGKILDQFVLATGYNRKHAICVLDKNTASPPSVKSNTVRRRRRKYGEEMEEPFIRLWRVSGGLCCKRLVPFLPDLIAALERHNELVLCPQVKTKLLAMSVSTAQRLLGRTRRCHERGLTTTLSGTLLRQQIPIRTFEDWKENRAGFMEIDLVAHCGGSAAGDYCYTLTMTDVCTGWTECAALANRSQITVQVAVEMIRKRMPFALLGIDSDNGSEFINHHLTAYCNAHKITFTRCRPYKKNDQCHVEQKNGAVVRPLVGYGRYGGIGAAEYLNRLYRTHRLLVNFFEPSMKLTGKSRTGSQVKKTYDTPKTPYTRLRGGAVLDRTEQDAMEAQYLDHNPARLRRKLEELEMGLKDHLTHRGAPCDANDKEPGGRHAQNA